MRKTMMSKAKFLKSAVASVMACALLVAGLPMLAPTTDVEAEVADGKENASYFFDAQKSKLTFNRAQESKWDRYDNAIGNVTDYDLRLHSSTDAKIVANGELQVDYEGKDNTTPIVSNSNYDGSYTIWGIGGNNYGPYNNVTFKIKATDPDVAKYMTVRFYNGGTNTLTKNFDDWMEEAGITDTSISVTDYDTITLPIPGSVNTAVQGMKISFDRANKSGTVYFGEVYLDKFSNNASDRTNPLISADDGGAMPLLRTDESACIQGEVTGYNIPKGQKWTMSTSDANIVNNRLSNGQALQIKYQKTAYHNTLASLEATTNVSGETVMGITIKGADTSASDLVYANAAQNVNVDDILNVVLYDGSTAVKTISFKDFYESSMYENKTHTNMSSSEYKTYYTDAVNGVEFDTVAFEIAGDDDKSYSGTVYVQNIFFPRYTYTVEHYFDNTIDSGKNEIYNGLKYGESIDGGYTDYSDTTYSISNVTYSNNAKEITGGSEVIKVYYTSGVDYTINYYYGGVRDNTKTVNGSGKIGDSVSWEHKNITGYKFAYATADSMILGTGTNEINVYYEKNSFGYTINYYYDGVIDDTKTDRGTAVYQSTVECTDKNITDKNITGYKFDNVSAKTITISANEAENVINVYYVKDSYGYTINYYYDGVKDDDKTETGTAVYQSTVECTDKNITDKNITGYKFDNVSAKTITISANEAENVINVYYVKDSFAYRVEYYYDGVIDDTKTDRGTAVYQSTVECTDKNITDKNITGFTFVSVSPAELTISEIEESNVIRVYYAKDSIPYTINYYYDGVKDDSKTEKGSAIYQSTVKYIDKNIKGYKFDYASAETITISNNAEDNVIDVYYVKDSFGYTINYYYDGVKDDDKTETGTAVYQSTVACTDKNITDKNIAGYKFDHISAETITITEVADNNVIDVYYVKDSFGYTINYYYDGVKDDSKTINGEKTLFGTEVAYEDKNITGYKFDHASAEKITIGTNEADNVIDVYYVKDSFSYKVEYYYDDVLGKTEDGTGLYGAPISYRDSEDGYIFVKVEGDAVITENNDANIVKVYFKSIEEETTVEEETTIEEETTEEPTTVKETETTTKKVTKTKSPKTGDSTNVFTFMIGLFAAAVLLGAVIIKRRKVTMED